MRISSTIATAVLCLAALPVEATNPTPTLTLFNNANSPMTDVAYAPTGTNRWFAMDGGAIAAHGKATVALSGAACVYDLRFRFEDRVTMTVKAWNACTNPVIEVGRHVAPAGTLPAKAG